MRCFEELSLKELKKQYDLSANNAIEYLKEFISKDQYNESVENILANLNIDENILYMNIEDENGGNKYVLISNNPMEELPIEPEEEVVEPIEFKEPDETFYKELDEITEEMTVSKLSRKFKEAVDNTILNDEPVSVVENGAMNLKLFLTTYGFGQIEQSYNKTLKTRFDDDYLDNIEKELIEESNKLAKRFEESLDATRKDLLTILNTTGGME